MHLGAADLVFAFPLYAVARNNQTTAYIKTIYTHTCTSTCIHIQTHTCIHIQAIYVYTYKYIYMYRIQTHTCIHIQIHTL